MNSLSPVSAWRTPEWWVLAVALGLVTTVGAVASSAVALPYPPVSPAYLPLGIGVAMLARWGRSAWPAFVVGDLAGQVLSGDPWNVVSLRLAPHLLLLVVGATAIQRWGAWLQDIGGAARYVAISAGLAVAGSVIGLLTLWVGGVLGSWTNVIDGVAFWALGDLLGYLVAGALVIAWSAPGMRQALRHPAAFAGTALMVAVAVWGVWADTSWVQAAILGVAGLMAALLGMRWGTVASAIAATAAAIDAVQGTAPYGGGSTSEQAFNAMFAMALFAGATLLLAGWREGPSRATPSRAMVAGITTAAMVIAGTAGFAANSITLQRGAPFGMAALLMVGATIGLAFVRLARAPERPSPRRSLAWAAAGGAIYVASLLLYQAALPRVGSGPATALAMTAPMAIVVLSAIVNRRWPSWTMVGVSLAVVAGATLTVAANGASGAGVTIALASAWVFGASIIVVAIALRHGDVVEVALTVAFVSALLATAASLATEGPSAMALDPQAAGEVLLGALGAQLVPALARTWSIPLLGAPVTGAIGVLGPVVTVALSMLLLSSGTTPPDVAGLILIALGGVTAALLPVLRGRRAGVP